MSSKRRAIGTNPLDQLVPIRTGPATEITPGAEVSAEELTRPEPTRPRALPGAKSEKPKKNHRLTVKVPDEMVEEVRDAVMFLHTQGVHTTLVGIIEDAVDAELKRLKRKHNEGQGFPSRKADVPVGRPISA